MVEREGAGARDSSAALAPPIPAVYEIVPVAAPIRGERLSLWEPPPQRNLMELLHDLGVAALVVDGHQRMITVAWVPHATPSVLPDEVVERVGQYLTIEPTRHILVVKLWVPPPKPNEKKPTAMDLMPKGPGDPTAQAIVASLHLRIALMGYL